MYEQQSLALMMTQPGASCLIYRNLELELELNELRNMLSRMEGSNSANELDSSKIDNLTRAELNRTMTEWSSRLETLLGAERGKTTTGDDNYSDTYKLKVCTMNIDKLQ